MHRIILPALLLAWGTSAHADETALLIPRTASPQAISDLATVVRSIGDVRDVSIYLSQNTVMVHGTANQTALSKWLHQQLIESPGAPGLITGFTYTNAEARDYDTSVAVFRLKPTSTDAELAEFTTVLRRIGDLRRAIVYRPNQAVVIRGTPEQVNISKWLYAQLYPAGGASIATAEQTVEGGEPIVYLHTLPGAVSHEQALALVTKIRSEAPIRRTHTFGNTIILRGTPDTIALARQILTREQSH